MQRDAWGTYKSGGKVPGECRECREIGENDGNIWEWVQGARGMHGNAGECQGNVWECKVPGECRGMTGESTGVGEKC